MKTLFCTFLSIFAFSSVTHAADDDEFGYDPEVDAAFSSLQITAPTVHTNQQSLSKNSLSKDLGTPTAIATDSEASIGKKPTYRKVYDKKLSRFRYVRNDS